MRRLLLIPAAAAAVLALGAPGTAGAATPRIVGGQPAADGAHRYVARVQIARNFMCTGTLVAPTWVLTAAHCGSLTGSIAGTPLTWPPQAITVTLGTVRTDGAGGEVHAVRSVRLHPDYLVLNGPGSDVALLELAEPSAIPPVQIAAASERSIWDPGRLMTIAGFGTTSPGGSVPAAMQVAQVPIVADADCARAYSDRTPVLGDAFDARTMVCAGYSKGGTDTCQGDSGGPLLAPLGDGRVRLVGATSYGEGCAEPGYPGVYARVAEGSNRAFVAEVVPAALAPEDAPPARSGPGAGDPGGDGYTQRPPAAGGGAKPARVCSSKLSVRISRPARGTLRRISVRVGSRTVLKRSGRALKPRTVRIGKHLSPTGRTTVRVVTRTSKGVQRTVTRTYSRCKLAKTRVSIKAPSR